MQTFNLDISAKRIVPLLNVKQGDVGARIAVAITNNGAAYTIPGNTVFFRVVLWCRLFGNGRTRRIVA